MTPAFFGPAGEQLLGIHHPARGAARGHGVVLCPSAPQERARSHWALHKLADQLAKGGLDVLRFDLRGTGDSNGELEDTTPEQWVEDVKRATRELKDLTGVRRISLVGLGFGAIVSAQAASQLTLDTLVLWEPVVHAWNWMSQLQLLEDELHRRELHFPTPPDAHEVFGFRLPAALFERWKALDLAEAPAWKARTEVVASRDDAHLERLRRAWAGAGLQARWHFVDGGAPNMAPMLRNEPLDEITRVLGEKR